MQLDDITPLILTYNEAPNIARTLSKLTWANRIVVIDSGSTDATLSILKATPEVAVIQRKFDSFAGQCNFGLSHIHTQWVLSLDADYVLSEALINEIKKITTNNKMHGYQVPFRYCIFGHPLRATLYPPRTVLYRCEQAHYNDEGHGHRVRIKGQISALQSAIYHDDRKPLSRWLDSQRSYAKLEADYLLAQQKANLNWPDRLRLRIWPAVPSTFLYTLLAKRCIFDGWPGWYYTLQRTYAEILLSLELLDRHLQKTHC